MCREPATDSSDCFFAWFTNVVSYHARNYIEFLKLNGIATKSFSRIDPDRDNDAG